MSKHDLQPSLFVERLTVRSDRVMCDIKLSPETPRVTWPALMERVRGAYPRLVFHTCVNDKGNVFGDVMACTAVPHLLEHLVIDIQTDMQASTCSLSDVCDFVFVGTSEWTDEPRGRAHIEVNFTDDLIALRAFCDAVNFLNKIMVF